MQAVVTSYLNGWYNYGGGLFNWFVTGPTNWTTSNGSWGLTNHIENLTSPKILGTQQIAAEARLAMQYGIKAANYPLIPEDFERGRLPGNLTQFRSKIFGLSITPERLAEVRNERRPGSKYAALENCRYEVNEAEAMMRREGIRWMSSTAKSIEEIAAMILQEIRLDKRFY